MYFEVGHVIYMSLSGAFLKQKMFLGHLFYSNKPKLVLT